MSIKGLSSSPYGKGRPPAFPQDAEGKALTSGNFTPKQRQFLTAYEQSGGINLASRATGIHKSTHAEWMRENRAYAEAFREIYEARIEKLEEELHRRAAIGINEPVVYRGQFSYPEGPDGKPDLSKAPLSIKRWSDQLLMFALRAARPDKYKDRSEVTAKWDGDISKLDKDQLAKLAESLQGIAFGSDPKLIDAAQAEVTIDVIAETPTDSPENTVSSGSSGSETVTPESELEPPK